MTVAHSMYRSGNRRRSARYAAHMSEINVTPFVDVMLVLLIVFMIAAPLLTVGVPLELPRGEAQPLPTELQEPLSIHIDSEGKVYIESVLVEDDELVDRLRAIVREGGERRVYLRADQSVSYGRAMKVLGALNISGLHDFGLVMDSGPSIGEEDTGDAEAVSQ